MKRVYISPQLSIYKIVGKETLLDPSIPYGETVGNEDDIGFVKRDRGSVEQGGRGGHGVWDDDWSKQ